MTFYGTGWCSSQGCLGRPGFRLLIQFSVILGLPQYGPDYSFLSLTMFLRRPGSVVHDRHRSSDTHLNLIPLTLYFPIPFPITYSLSISNSWVSSYIVNYGPFLGVFTTSVRRSYPGSSSLFTFGCDSLHLYDLSSSIIFRVSPDQVTEYGH